MDWEPGFVYARGRVGPTLKPGTTGIGIGGVGINTPGPEFPTILPAVLETPISHSSSLSSAETLFPIPVEATNPPNPDFAFRLIALLFLGTVPIAVAVFAMIATPLRETMLNGLCLDGLEATPDLTPAMMGAPEVPPCLEFPFTLELPYELEAGADAFAARLFPDSVCMKESTISKFLLFGLELDVEVG